MRDFIDCMVCDEEFKIDPCLFIDRSDREQ